LPGGPDQEGRTYVAEGDHDGGSHGVNFQVLPGCPKSNFVATGRRDPVGSWKLVSNSLWGPGGLGNTEVGRELEGSRKGSWYPPPAPSDWGSSHDLLSRRWAGSRHDVFSPPGGGADFLDVDLPGVQQPLLGSLHLFPSEGAGAGVLADHGWGVVRCVPGRAEVLVLVDQDLQDRQVDLFRLVLAGGPVYGRAGEGQEQAVPVLHDYVLRDRPVVVLPELDRPAVPLWLAVFCLDAFDVEAGSHAVVPRGRAAEAAVAVDAREARVGDEDDAAAGDDGEPGEERHELLDLRAVDLAPCEHGRRRRDAH